jgi:hypothetical protein
MPLKEGEVWLKMTIPEKLRDDFKTVVTLDGISIKGKLMMLMDAEVRSRRADIDEIESRRRK